MTRSLTLRSKFAAPMAVLLLAVGVLVFALPGKSQAGLLGCGDDAAAYSGKTFMIQTDGVSLRPITFQSNGTIALPPATLQASSWSASATGLNFSTTGLAASRAAPPHRPTPVVSEPATRPQGPARSRSSAAYSPARVLAALEASPSTRSDGRGTGRLLIGRQVSSITRTQHAPLWSTWRAAFSTAERTKLLRRCETNRTPQTHPARGLTWGGSGVRSLTGS